MTPRFSSLAFGSTLSLNIHCHRLSLDRVHLIDESGQTIFQHVPDPGAQVVAASILRTNRTPAQTRHYGSWRTNAGRIQAQSTYVGERIAKTISGDLLPIMVVRARGIVRHRGDNYGDAGAIGRVAINERRPSK
jgi:hypothetical protein